MQVAREEHNLADVGRLHEMHHPSLESDREAAVGRDSAPEGLDVGGVGLERVSPLGQCVHVVVVAVQALGAADQFGATEDEVEGARPAWVLGVGWL